VSAAVDTIEIPVGPLTFDGLAAGPDGGEPVLLLHGFPQTSRAWESQLGALGDAGYRAVAFDQRGYSPRARPAEVEAYRSSELTADVIAVAGALGFDRFHLIGHDWGGAVAWQVGGRHGDRLRTLTVVSTPHPAAMGLALDGQIGGDQAQRSGYMEIFRAPDSQDQFLANEALGLKNLYMISGMPEGKADPYLEALDTPEALGAALNWYRAADLTLTEGLGPITVPTMYVWSTADPALGREAAEATGRFVAGPYRFEVLEGVGHWVSEQVPERLNALLLDHIRRPD
jgi:pimeloyl-ACP methyl ester carboxylesterase